MQLVIVSGWAVKPPRRGSFRVGSSVYYCHLRVGPIALITYIRSIT